MNIAIGRTGMRLSAVASYWDSIAKNFGSHELRAELVLDDNNSKTYLEQLFSEKEKIEKEINEPLTWHNPPEKRMCRIYLRKTTNLQNTDKWPEQHKWLLEKLETLYRVFSMRVKKLEIK